MVRYITRYRTLNAGYFLQVTYIRSNTEKYTEFASASEAFQQKKIKNAAFNLTNKVRSILMYDLNNADYFPLK